MRPTITAHCLVRNEENWVWYAISSVINYVDRIIVFDTGSTDRTVDIIKSIKSPKITFAQKGAVDKTIYPRLRQEMLEQTKTDWFLILDGDEIWPEKTITQLIRAIQHAPRKDAVIVPLWLCVGDVFHYDHYWASNSNFVGSKVVSYMQARAIRVQSGLKVIGEYGYESYADRSGQNVSDWDYARFIFLKEKYLHMSLLPRSRSVAHDRLVMQRAFKTRFTKGAPFPDNFRYPRVFYSQRPKLVPSPWRKHTWIDTLKGIYYRPLNFILRHIN